MVKKKIIIFFILNILSLVTYCQKDTLSEDFEIVSALESWPSFSGGQRELEKKIYSSIEFPTSAIKDSLSGTVYIQMLVDTSGFTSNHIVIKGIRQDIDMEAIRVAKTIRFDNPATQFGKPVCVKYSLPIIFDLSQINKARKRK